MVDFSHLPTHCKFVALMPQWDFLNFLAKQGKRYPDFHLRMQTEATDLISRATASPGCAPRRRTATSKSAPTLVVGCDGRHSTVRERAGLTVEDIGAPIDVLWFRLSRQARRHRGDRRPHRGRQDDGHAQPRRLLAVRLCHPEGRHRDGEARGPARRSASAWSALSPFLRDRVGELKSFDDIKLLTVAIDRLRQWHRPGLLCIGDAAHAMSPVGGVGVNLAVQDAVAAANILAEPLRAGAVTREHLAAVQAAPRLSDEGHPARCR